MNVLDFLGNGLWLGPRWRAQTDMLGATFKAPADTMSTVGWTVADLLLGVVTVWLYAGIRPRFGPGPKTGLIAGLALWLITRTYFASYAFHGCYTWRLIAVSSAASLVAMLAAAYVGGMLYQEE